MQTSIYDKIFQRFRRAEETHTREYGGTGLGLSILKPMLKCRETIYGLNPTLEKVLQFYFSLPSKPGFKKEKNAATKKR